jgi:hypothetical protein
MTGDEDSSPVVGVDTQARPAWMRTGYKFFPYAARQSDQWWVLRSNFDFPVHDLYTLFVDGVAAVDVTGDIEHSIPLVAGVGSLRADGPVLKRALAEAVVRQIAAYVVYGSEVNDPCASCSHLADHDPMTWSPPA